MLPVLLHGRVVWDQNRFPRDECEERLLTVQARVAREGLKGLLVAGARPQYADLCYLTQFVPYAAWALAVVPVEGDITLVTGVGGGRELPASRARTWVPDVRNLPNLGPALVDLLHERGINERLGLIGLDALPVGLEQRLRSNLGGAFDSVDANELLVGVRAGLRSREISAVRHAAEITHSARVEVERAHLAGASNAAALIEGERVARRLGALDVRSLVNLEGPQLAPIEGLSGYRSDPLLGYLAVNSLGYWAEVAMIAGAADPRELGLAREALAAMARLARTGVPAAELASAAAQTLAAEASPPDASAYSKRLHPQDLGWGNAVGLSLCEAPEIAASSTHTLVEDAVLVLRVRLPGAFASDLVRVTPTGGVSLWP
jgi:Xaa-Pro aminopeptidase